MNNATTILTAPEQKIETEVMFRDDTPTERRTWASATAAERHIEEEIMWENTFMARLLCDGVETWSVKGTYA